MSASQASLSCSFSSKGLTLAGCGSLAVADVNNLYQLWGLLVLASLGIGGIVVPATIITTIICPDDLIGTITALTLAIRLIGGIVGYTVYVSPIPPTIYPARTTH